MTFLNAQTLYILRALGEDLARRKFATFLTVLVIAVSLTLPTVSYLLWKNTRQAVQQFYPEPELTVYLHKNLTEQDIQRVVENLRKFETDKIEQVHYISREQSMSEFRSWSSTIGDALDILDDNPLPAVVVLKPKKSFSDDSQMQALRQNLQQIKGIQDVRLDNDWIGKLAILNQLIAKIAVTCTLLMLASVFLVIGNSIRSDVAGRHKEINVMQLLGATDYFITRPFLYMAMFYGLLGSLLAILFSSITVGYFADIVRYVAEMFTVTFEITLFDFSEFLFIVVASIFLAWLSAQLATNRYLRRLDKA